MKTGQDLNGNSGTIARALASYYKPRYLRNFDKVADQWEWNRINSSGGARGYLLSVKEMNPVLLYSNKIC